MPEKPIELTEIATEILVKELDRRARQANLTTEQLIEQASENWTEAEREAEELKNRGHEE